MTAKDRILIGCIGRGDPVSERGDRPIVTAAWALQPVHVYLIYSNTTEDECGLTNRYLWDNLGLQRVIPKTLHEIDPVDYDEIIDPLAEILESIGSSHSGDEFHIVESGTPAMKVVCMMATLSRLIRAKIWHVNDPDEDAKLLADLPRERAISAARARLRRTNLDRFEGAALRYYRDLKLTISHESQGGTERILACLVPGRWFDKRDSTGPAMKILYELALARRGDKYDVSENGGWLSASRLTWMGLESNTRTNAINAINDDFSQFVEELKESDLDGKKLIEQMGSSRDRKFRLLFEPHEIEIKHIESDLP